MCFWRCPSGGANERQVARHCEDPGLGRGDAAIHFAILDCFATLAMTMKESRPLTPGELALARSVFGDAIDYSRVSLIEGKWWPLQPRRSAMAPTGDIYFHPDRGGWSHDFSKEDIRRQAFFIHEMTHVWQAQAMGRFYLPLMRHPFCRYRYQLKPGRPFHRYGLEQQAEIVKDRFLADRGHVGRQIPPPDLLPFAPQACRNPATAAAGK